MNDFIWSNSSGYTSSSTNVTWYTTVTPSQPVTPKKEAAPETAIDWLDRRVNEITDLVGA